MKTAAQLIPALFDAFRDDLRPYKGTDATPEGLTYCRERIAHYASRLQTLDLSLSQQQARAMLAQVYRQL
jgi:hypothetical protein